MSYPFSPGTGAGKPIEPKQSSTPKPEAKPAEGAPKPVVEFGGKKYEESTSFGSRVLPAFAPVASVLGRQLEKDRREREATAREALGPSEGERLRMHRELLAEQVRDGDLTNAEANALFERAHPGVDPATLKPRSRS